jgi:hypothetical protein
MYLDRTSDRRAGLPNRARAALVLVAAVVVATWVSLVAAVIVATWGSLVVVVISDRASAIVAVVPPVVATVTNWGLVPVVRTPANLFVSALARRYLVGVILVLALLGSLYR